MLKPLLSEGSSRAFASCWDSLQIFLSVPSKRSVKQRVSRVVIPIRAAW